MKLCKASYKQNQNQTKKYEASEFHNMFSEHFKKPSIL